MIAARQSMLCLLCLLLAGCSVEATLLSQRASSQSKRVITVKIAPTDVGEAEPKGNETGKDDDGDDDDGNNDAQDSVVPVYPVAPGAEKTAPYAGGDKTPPVALPQMAKQPIYQVVSAPSPAGFAAPAPATEDEDEDEAPSGPHAAEEAKLKKAVQMSVSALAKNQQQQEQLIRKLDYWSDTSRANKDIDASTKLVANETESPALASTLGSMWKEMRMFDVPFYAENLQDQIDKLKGEQSVLKYKRKVAKDNLKDAQKRWAGLEEEEEKGKAMELEEDEEASVTLGHIYHRASADRWNFWGMNRKQKDSFLHGWIVYLVAGCALAFLHSKARIRNPKIFIPEARHDISRGLHDFSFSIFGCLGAPNVCVLGCLLPCLAWSDTVDKSGFLSYWKAFCAFFLLTLLYCFTYGIAAILVVVLGVYYRQKLRYSYEMETGTIRSIGFDVLAWLFCQPCAIIQEAREESVDISNDP